MSDPGWASVWRKTVCTVAVRPHYFIPVPLSPPSPVQPPPTPHESSTPPSPSSIPVWSAGRLVLPRHYYTADALTHERVRACGCVVMGAGVPECLIRSPIAHMPIYVFIDTVW